MSSGGDAVGVVGSSSFVGDGSATGAAAGALLGRRVAGRGDGGGVGSEVVTIGASVGCSVASIVGSDGVEAEGAGSGDSLLPQAVPSSVVTPLQSPKIAKTIESLFEPRV